MYLIILGSGAIGSRLTDLALRDGHDVVLIEENEERAKAASEQFNALVLNADIARGGVMEEAGANQAQALVATTSDDAANLMAILLGVEKRIETLVSVVNDSGHEEMFKRFGAHVLLDPEEVVARHLYGILRQPNLANMNTPGVEEKVFGITLGPTSPLIDKTIRTIYDDRWLPKGYCIVAMKREEDERQLVTEDTTFKAGDALTIYTLVPVKESHLKVFTGETST